MTLSTTTQIIECRYAERIIFIVMLSVITLSVSILNAAGSLIGQGLTLIVKIGQQLALR